MFLYYDEERDENESDDEYDEDLLIEPETDQLQLYAYDEESCPLVICYHTQYGSQLDASTCTCKCGAGATGKFCQYLQPDFFVDNDCRCPDGYRKWFFNFYVLTIF